MSAEKLHQTLSRDLRRLRLAELYHYYSFPVVWLVTIACMAIGYGMGWLA